jgi:hypothetical protein
MTVPQSCMSGNRYFQPSGFSHCGRYSGQAAGRTREEMGFAFRQRQKTFALLQSIQNSSRARPASLSMEFSQGDTEICSEYKSGVHKPRATKTWYCGAKYLLALSMKLASCHPSRTWNFEVAPTFLKIIWTHGLYPLGFRFMCHHPQVILACLIVSKA